MKKGAAGGKKPVVKKGKAAKDPNKPKRPASAFFVFMYVFFFPNYFPLSVSLSLSPCIIC